MTFHYSNGVLTLYEKGDDFFLFHRPSGKLVKIDNIIGSLEENRGILRGTPQLYETLCNIIDWDSEDLIFTYFMD